MAIPLVMNDMVQATCTIHLVPNPSSGAPQPGPPMPFIAPLTMGLSTSVTIGGKAVALMGSSGVNSSPHPGLHPSDPYMVPTLQQAQVMTGSPTVTVDGKPIATTDSVITCCGIPGGSAIPASTSVTVG